MSEQRLPRIIEPMKLVAAGAAFDGIIPLDLLSRLQEELIDSSSEDSTATVELSFQKDDHGNALAKGSMRAEVRLECQRCLHAVPVTLEAVIYWAFVRDEQALANIPGSAEAVLVQDGGISLYDLLEDELLLALPTVPMHGENECKVPDHVSGEGGSSTVNQGRVSPFNVLEDMKKK